jgi:hypothetical protein
MVTARVLASLKLFSWMHIVVGVDLDYDLGRHRYVTAATLGGAGATSGAAVAVLDPWPLRPSLLIGLCFPLIEGRGITE